MVNFVLSSNNIYYESDLGALFSNSFSLKKVNLNNSLTVCFGVLTRMIF